MSVCFASIEIGIMFYSLEEVNFLASFMCIEITCLSTKSAVHTHYLIASENECDSSAFFV